MSLVGVTQERAAGVMRAAQGSVRFLLARWTGQGEGEVVGLLRAQVWAELGWSSDYPPFQAEQQSGLQESETTVSPDSSLGGSSPASGGSGGDQGQGGSFMEQGEGHGGRVPHGMGASWDEHVGNMSEANEDSGANMEDGNDEDEDE